MGYRYHVGDKVIVKSDLHEATDWRAGDRYRMRSGPQAGGWCACYKKHLPSAGTTITIKECYGGYRVEENDLYFVDDMFEGLAVNECCCESLL